MDDNKHLWDQFIRLGERIGDGDLGPDEKWMLRDYKRISKILIPEIKADEKEVQQMKNKNRDTQMTTLLENKKCKCGGTLKQTRSGSLTADCTTCGARYKAKTKK